MKGFGSISEAAYLAIYSMILFVRSGKSLNASEVASRLFASRHHVSKILLLLQQNNYLGSARGPRGGFYLRKDASRINLLEIYELASGKMKITECAFNRKKCPFAQCVFEHKINELKIDFREFLREKTLDEYAKPENRNGHITDSSHGQ
ncbi:MAG: Rrf2 family transcriptional regulator [Bacteroidales bacterium]|nr:Rrf2 family transcriptional regulator [Bacteroidales bacterium]MCF8386876.1 Rrf2 family transcriptional regulator [Bacteroidales bacterium]MCF8396563.1 Rrf2 family transcriptional regulator [Bacteroidales bacterium]